MTDLNVGSQVWIQIEGYPWWPAEVVDATVLGFEQDASKVYARFYGTHDAYVEDREVAQASLLPLEYASEKAQWNEPGLQEALNEAQRVSEALKSSSSTTLRIKRVREDSENTTHPPLLDHMILDDETTIPEPEGADAVQDQKINNNNTKTQEGNDEDDDDLAQLLSDDSEQVTQTVDEDKKRHKREKKHKKHKKKEKKEKKEKKSESKHKKKRSRSSFIDDAAQEDEDEGSTSRADEDEMQEEEEEEEDPRRILDRALSRKSQKDNTPWDRDTAPSRNRDEKRRLLESSLTQKKSARPKDPEVRNVMTRDDESDVEDRCGRERGTPRASVAELLDYREQLEKESENPNVVRKVLIQLTRVTLDYDSLATSKIGIAVADVLNRAIKDTRLLPYQTLAQALLLSWVSVLPEKVQQHLREIAAGPHLSSGTTLPPSSSLDATTNVPLQDCATPCHIEETVVPVPHDPEGREESGSQSTSTSFTPKSWSDHVRDRLRNVVGDEASESICEALNQEGRFTSTVARELVVALEKNSELCTEVRSGAVTSDALIQMDRSELAPRSVKEQLDHLRNENTLNLVALSKPSATLISTTLPCEKCGVSHASFYSQQMRGADEPMTTFYNCLNCGYAWRVD